MLAPVLRHPLQQVSSEQIDVLGVRYDTERACAH